MNSALFYLYTRSFAGAVRQRLARLKQPKYLIGALFGAVYFYLYFFRFLFLREHQGAPPTPPEVSALGENLAALLLFAALLVFAWIIPGKRTALMFSEAEIAALFSGPLTRRELVRYKLLTSQLGILIFAVMMTFITGRGTSGQGWLHLAGWWIIIAVFALHRLGASFAITRLMERGMANWQRRAALLGGVAALLGLLFAWRQFAPSPPELQSLSDPDKLAAYLQEVLQSGPGPWLLTPFRFIVRPHFANDWLTFAQAAWPALCILILHYWWVLRADVSFEEASIALAQHRAALVDARRKGDFRGKLAPRQAKSPAFSLRPTGWKPLAFVWKALLYSGGQRILRAWGIALMVLLALAAVLTLRYPSDGLSLALAVCGGAIFFITLFANLATGATYLRRDLAAMDLLQTFPIRGWQVVLGQLGTQAALGTLIEWAGLLLAATGLVGLGDVVESRAGEIFSVAAGIALLAFPLNLTMMIIPAGTLLLWPAWFKGGAQSAGFEAVGLRLMLLLGQLLAMALALILPGIAVGALAVAAQWYHLSYGWMPLAGAVAALLLALQAGVGILGLGLLFERFDVSEE
jgi:hypothetical protein